MQPLNWLMNRTANMAESESAFKNISTRVTLIGALPCEILAMAQNTLQLPFIAVSTGVKLTVKVVNLFIGAKFLRRFEEALPGAQTFVITALKIVGYAIGFISTVVLGILISPKINFDLHVSLRLIQNQKAEALAVLRQQQEAKKRAALQVELKTHLQNMAAANSAKIAEREKALQLEAQQQKLVAEPVVVQIASTPEPLPVVKDNKEPSLSSMNIAAEKSTEAPLVAPHDVFEEKTPISLLPELSASLAS